MFAKTHTRKRDNLNKAYICFKELEPITSNLPKQKVPDPCGSTGEFYQTFKEEIIPGLCSLVHRTKADRTLPNSFCETNVILIPKPDRDVTRKENYKLLSPVNIDTEILNKIDWTQQCIKRITYFQVGFIPDIQGWFNIPKSINVINTSTGNKNHMISSKDVENQLTGSNILLLWELSVN